MFQIKQNVPVQYLPYWFKLDHSFYGRERQNSDYERKVVEGIKEYKSWASVNSNITATLYLGGELNGQ